MSYEQKLMEMKKLLKKTTTKVIAEDVPEVVKPVAQVTCL